MPPEVVAETAAPTTASSVTSGTASDAMIKAAMSASAADTPSPEGRSGTEPAAAGDTTPPASDDTAGANADTTGPQTVAGSPDVTGTQGPIPFDRHKTILDNARRKASEETEAKYAWTRELPRGQEQFAVNVATQLLSDPVAFGHKVAKELGMRLVPIEAARTEDEGELVADLVSEDGRKAYSADVVNKLAERIRREFRGELQPLMEDRRAAKAAAEARQLESEAGETVAEVMTEARTWDHFTKENEPKIHEILMAIPAEKRRRLGPAGAVAFAYNAFLKQSVFPSVESAAEQRVRENLNRKAATSTGGAHPTDSGGTGKKVELRNAEDLAKHMERLSGATA